MHTPYKGVLLDTRAGCACVCATAMLIGTISSLSTSPHLGVPVSTPDTTKLLPQSWCCKGFSCKCCLVSLTWKARNPSPVVTGTLPVQAGNRWGANDAVEYATHSRIVAWSEGANKPCCACKIFPQTTPCSFAHIQWKAPLGVNDTPHSVTHLGDGKATRVLYCSKEITVISQL